MKGQTYNLMNKVWRASFKKRNIFNIWLVQAFWNLRQQIFMSDVCSKSHAMWIKKFLEQENKLKGNACAEGSLIVKYMQAEGLLNGLVMVKLDILKCTHGKMRLINLLL